MEHFITNEENTKNKLFIARQLDDEKMSVVSMNVRIASGWLMSFFVLVGIVIILFVTYKNFTTKEKWIIIWVGIGLIFFGLAIGFIMTNINLFFVNKKIKQKMNNNYHNWYLSIYSNVNQIKCSKIDNENWMFEYKHKKYIVNFNLEKNEFTVSQNGNSHVYLNTSHIFHHSYNRRFDYLNYITNSYYRYAIVNASSTFCDFAINDLNVLISEFENFNNK
ncbi:MAG: hypothetical protein SOT25_00520 [Malacoplasma sp.]|nr:hypothetical protein [Mycoplasmataceae bacterium]MDY2887248.1 hypothetical protein [Malacoplasma sp.]